MQLALPPIQNVPISIMNILIASRADIGPFTDINIEQAALIGAVAGGIGLAGLITFVITKY